VKVTFTVLVNRLNPVRVYTLPTKVQLEPVREPVQVADGVNSLGTVISILRRVGSGALMVKGDVILRLRVEELSRVSKLVGV